MNTPRLLLFALLLLATGGWECGASYTKDPGFEVWCDDKLCHWEVEQGLVEPVPTWHEGDRGARLSGGAVISQLLPIDSTDTTCLGLILVGAGEGGGALRFELDFLDDQSVEVSREITLQRSFSEQRFQLRTPAWYRDVRVRVEQLGQSVTLARLRIESGGDCAEATEPAPELQDLPLGATCAKDQQCASGICCQGICSECCAGAPCDAPFECAPAKVAEREPPLTGDLDPYLPKLCAPPASTLPSGERCHDDGACVSGRCLGQSWKRCALSATSCESDDDCPYACLDLGQRDGLCE